MTDKTTPTIREAVGVFHEAELLKAALRDLDAAGFGSSEVGLLAGEYTVRESLTELYDCCIDGSPGSLTAASEAFVMKESSGNTGDALGGHLYYVGTAGVAGGAVASAGVLGGALLSAVTGALAAGAVGAVVAGIIHQDEADFLHQQLDEGRLLLFVRAPDADRERTASKILARHTDFKVRTVEVPAR